MNGPYNFKDPEVRAKALYKLWVRYKPQYVNGKLPEVKAYYSYDRPGSPEHGKAMLLKMLRGRMEKVQVAILYDNIENKIINIYKA